MAREGLNKVILIGNLGADPELNFTQGGQARLNIRLATSETYTDKSGVRQEKTEWHTVILWGKRAEALGKFLAKGRSICVEGSIEYRQWEDKEGNKRKSTQIRANNVILLGSKDGGEAAPRGDFGGGGGGVAKGGYDDFPADDFADDEIPF